jgi:hypothetical protein
MAKKKRKRRRSTSEKVIMILGILIALSMILGLFVGLGGGRSGEQAPLPIEHFEDIEAEGLNDSGGAIPESGSGVPGLHGDPPG